MRSSSVKLRASHSASGESSTGPRIGRHTLTMPNRCFNSSSASAPRWSRTRRGAEFTVWSLCTWREGTAIPYRVALRTLWSKTKTRLAPSVSLQQALDLGVVDPLDLSSGVEVADRGRRLDQRETVAVEGELRLMATRVLDPDVVRIIDAVPARHAGRRLGDIARGFFFAALQVVQSRGDGSGGRHDVEWHRLAPPANGWAIAAPGRTGRGPLQNIKRHRAFVQNFCPGRPMRSVLELATPPAFAAQRP